MARAGRGHLELVGEVDREQPRVVGVDRDDDVLLEQLEGRSSIVGTAFVRWLEVGHISARRVARGSARSPRDPRHALHAVAEPERAERLDRLARERRAA